MSKYTKDFDNKLVDYYLKGNSSITCGKIFGVSSTKVNSTVVRMGFRMRTMSQAKRRYTLDETYFECINTQDKAYLLGFLFGDGYNSNKCLELTLQERDISVLNSLKKSLNSESPIVDKFNSKYQINYKRLIIYSEKLCKDLSSLGCITNKSHVTKFPLIPVYLYRHFIRGLFDADGNIYISTKNPTQQFSILGNSLLINEVVSILESELLINHHKMHYDKRHRSNIVSLRFSRKLDCIKIREYLYQEANLYLSRKREKFNLIIQKSKTNARK